ncbi:DUF2711 family protein [Vogesella sp. LIG4]|uniref:DUF2711 family protein n=1 Tax=Vogesella sp. LIG4 TaxID=1192162 RepID=UPI00081FC80F|nr:DUF2711 family protein [Vogesella sp. LIG4]SCK04849.1 Protein of unknown function [Vogesella sp. LIG4]
MGKTLMVSKPSCIAPQDGYILEQLREQFAAAYVLLHPFLRPHALPLSRFTPDSYPDRSEIVADCQPVNWQSVASATGLPDIAAIDIALCTQSHSLRQQLCRDDYAQQLAQYCEGHGLVPPDKGELPEIWQDQLLLLLAGNSDSVWYGDEFGDHCQLLSLARLGSDHQAPHSHPRFFSPDGELMLSTHWDSYYSLVAGSPERLRPFTCFEGFYCQPDTRVRWSLPPKSAGA